MMVTLRNKPIRFQPILSFKIRAVARRTLTILTSGRLSRPWAEPARWAGTLFTDPPSSTRTGDAARDRRDDSMPGRRPMTGMAAPAACDGLDLARRGGF